VLFLQHADLLAQALLKLAKPLKLFPRRCRSFGAAGGGYLMMITIASVILDHAPLLNSSRVIGGHGGGGLRGLSDVPVPMQLPLPSCCICIMYGMHGATATGVPP